MLCAIRKTKSPENTTITSWLQTNQLHREEETRNTYSRMTARRQLNKSDQLSLP